MKLHELYSEIANELNYLGDEAKFEAKIIVCSLLSISADKYYMNKECALSEEIIDSAHDIVKKRLTGYPLQYILGKWCFYGRDFIVSPECLIPRQDSEILCEEAIKIIKQNNYASLLDVCTGSGCIGITLAKETNINTTISDISQSALEIAKKNAKLHTANIKIIQSDLFNEIHGTYDLITINPPYLDDTDMLHLQKELEFEPRNALYGGTDGMDFYKRIADEFISYISDSGTLILEIGAKQGNAISSLFNKCRIIKDYGNNDRVAIIHKADYHV